MEARIGLGMDGLDARRIVDVGHGGIFGARHIELFDAEQRLFRGGHRPLAALHDIGHEQHVRTVVVEIEPFGGVAAQHRGCKWPERFPVLDLEIERRLHVARPSVRDDRTITERARADAQGLARWAMTAADIRKHAAELVAFAPDVILAHGAVTGVPLLQATRTIPIVFPVAGDPVAAGLVDSLARPGGNATGFMIFEYSLSGKWRELLKEIAPRVTRAAVLRDPP